MLNVRKRGIAAIETFLRSRAFRTGANIFGGIVVALLIFFVFMATIGIDSISRNSGLYSSLAYLPERPIGIVLWASVRSSGAPSSVLADRLETAIEAYRTGKIRHILVSGDNATLQYNESTAMKKFLISRSIPESAITVDYAGFDTYDTMWRARYVFGVESAVVFTQAFHLPRSVYLARSLGIDCVGMASDRTRYAGKAYFELREFFARIKAVFEITLWSRPRFDGPAEYIMLTSDTSPDTSGMTPIEGE